VSLNQHVENNAIHRSLASVEDGMRTTLLVVTVYRSLRLSGFPEILHELNRSKFTSRAEGLLLTVSIHVQLLLRAFAT
jgi:hypothetical protein